MTNSLSDWASPIDTTITQNKNSKTKTMKNNAKKIDKHKFRKLLNDNSDSDSDSDSASASCACN